MIQYVFILLQLAFAVYLIFYIIAFLSGAPFVPTTNPTADAMIRLARLKKGMVAYDLGSGDGKLLLLIANNGARAVGLEINPLLVLYTYLRFLPSSVRSLIEVRWKNFWDYSFSDADALFVYLLPLRMKKLEEKIIKECRKGTRVISNSFMFPNLHLISTDTNHHIYVYRV